MGLYVFFIKTNKKKCAKFTCWLYDGNIMFTGGVQKWITLKANTAGVYTKRWPSDYKVSYVPSYSEDS